MALIAVAGCSGDNGGGDDPTTPPSPTDTSSATQGPTDTTTATQAPTETSTATGSPTAGSAQEHHDGLLDAGATAEQAVSDSTLISIELESNGWEAQVVTADGTEHEMTVSTDGAQVVSGPTEDKEDADDRAKHRQRLADSSVDYRQAVDAVLDEVSEGKITELDLDTWNGRAVWEADVREDSGTKRELKVDASSGEILANRVDG